jgi:hypothetical protein
MFGSQTREEAPNFDIRDKVLGKKMTACRTTLGASEADSEGTDTMRGMPAEALTGGKPNRPAGRFSRLSPAPLFA